MSTAQVACFCFEHACYLPTVLSFNTFLPSPYTWRQLSQASWCLLILGSAVSQNQADAGGVSQKDNTDLKHQQRTCNYSPITSFF